MKCVFRILMGMALLTVAACANFPLQTRSQVNERNESAKLSEQVNAVQRSRADQDAKLNELQQDVRAINGRVEALEHSQGQDDQSMKQQIDALNKKMDATNERIRLLEQHVDATEMRIMAAINMASREPVPAEKPKGKAGKGGKASAATASDGGTEVVASGAGAPSDEWAEAEKRFAAKEWKKAIVAYSKYREKSPKGKNSAEATYKIGVCFSELGLKKEARTFFEQTVNDFPNSPATRKAKYRLSNLK